jgi:hypothetical protein
VQTPPNDGRPLPFKEAMVVHRAHGFKLIREVPMGYVPGEMASANAGSVQGISEFRWSDSSGKQFVFNTLVRPAGRADHVLALGPGAMTGLDVQGLPAQYLQDDGTGFARLVWYDGAVEYELSSNGDGLELGDFLRMAESAL